MTNPRPQDLPQCPRHPGRRCPGECQYHLPPDTCIYDRGPETPADDIDSVISAISSTRPSALADDVAAAIAGYSKQLTEQCARAETWPVPLRFTEPRTAAQQVALQLVLGHLESETGHTRIIVRMVA